MYNQFFTEGMPSLLEFNKTIPCYNTINRSDEMNIINNPTASYAQCEAWLKTKTYASPLAMQNLPLLWKAAINNGIDPVVLIAQAMLETGYFKFGGVIDSSFHNTCGLKATKGGGDYVANAHMRFKTWEDGIQAHSDHLALYAGSPNCPKYSPDCASHTNEKYKCNGTTKDPRHFTYLYGQNKTVKSLQGTWATDTKYESKMMSIIKEIQNTKIEENISQNSSNKTITVNNTQKETNTRTRVTNTTKGPLNNKTIWNNIANGLKGGVIKPFKKR